MKYQQIISTFYIYNIDFVRYKRPKIIIIFKYKQKEKSISLELTFYIKKG
jgi:hypothetical protein